MTRFIRSQVTRLYGLAALAVLLLIGPAHAHHTPAGFDTGKTVTITGVVKKYEWFNPHVYITLETTNESGQKVEVEVECQPPSFMTRMGWTRETLKVGDWLTITGNPGKDKSGNGFLAGTIKRADQTLMSMAKLVQQFSPDKNAPKFVAKTLAGTWLAQTSFGELAPLFLPSAVQLTEEGARILKSFDEKTGSPGLNCISITAPISMLIPDLKHITISDGILTLKSEFDEATRTIRLNESSHEGAMRSHQGHSIAKWEGKTLVIDSTHFAYHAYGNGFGAPSGTQKRLIEKLTPSADGTSLTYQFEMHDPEFLKAPKTGKAEFAYRPDLKFAPPPCDLENARRFIKH